MKKSYVVLGATGGIGSELCRLLSANANLFIAGRDESKLVALAAELNCEFQVLDACKFDEVAQCFAKAKEKFERVDGAVNCVGSILLKPAHLTSEQEFHSVISTNLASAFACVRAAAMTMRGEGGSVVLVSSAAGSIGLANHESIAAAKAGIEGLTLSASASYARSKIRFNCVAPGLVQTELTKRITQNEASRKSSLDMHALGRLGDAIDIASAIAWLLGDDSSWITGQVLGVDGGLSKLKVMPSR